MFSPGGLHAVLRTIPLSSCFYLLLHVRHECRILLRGKVLVLKIKDSNVCICRKWPEKMVATLMQLFLPISWLWDSFRPFAGGLLLPCICALVTVQQSGHAVSPAQAVYLGSHCSWVTRFSLCAPGSTWPPTFPGPCSEFLWESQAAWIRVPSYVPKPS